MGKTFVFTKIKAFCWKKIAVCLFKLLWHVCIDIVHRKAFNCGWLKNCEKTKIFPLKFAVYIMVYVIDLAVTMTALLTDWVVN